MSKDSMPVPLPPMSAATLLRALFKRPAAASATATAPTRYRLDRIDADQVARYRHALGFTGAHLPLTYCYLLAQRAHLATMLGAAFPFRLVGAIHVDNLLRAGVQPAAGRPLVLATTVAIAPPAPNGAVHAALETEATQDGGQVFACRSTYLVARGQHSGGPRPPPAAAPELAPIAGWQLPHAGGRAKGRRHAVEDVEAGVTPGADCGGVAGVESGAGCRHCAPETGRRRVIHRQPVGERVGVAIEDGRQPP